MALRHLLTSFVLACLLAFTLQIYFSSPISPVSLHLPPPSSASHLPKNNILQKVIKLGDGVLLKPEDVDVDKEGTIYTATRDGWIKRLHKNGNWENWKRVNSDTVLGITITKEGDVVACDTEEGLLKITENGVKLLTSHVNGSKIRFADDVIEASDGSLYFSVASTKFGLHDWYLDVLEAKPHGQLLKYDPSSGETSILLDNLGFANGVAVSKDQDYLVVCETWKFRCQRHWLKGENKGKTEIFIENLPGGPDNINLAPDGSFWIALLQDGIGGSLVLGEAISVGDTATEVSDLTLSWKSLLVISVGPSTKGDRAAGGSVSGGASSDRELLMVPRRLVKPV